jgi:hypothetical protein
MTAADLAAPTGVTTQKTSFYFWTAVAMMAVAIAGFAPTFWIPLAQGLPERFPLYAVHGMACYAWVALLIYQSWLARSGRIPRHRNVGLIGISLATALVMFGLMTTADAVRRTITPGNADGTEAFMIVNAGGLVGFTAFVAAALFNLQRPEWHKRLMIAATNGLLGAPSARLLMTGGHVPMLNGTVGLAGLPPAPPLPVAFSFSGLFIAELFIVAGMVNDWRARGRVHSAYLWAAGFYLSLPVLAGPISATSIWHHIARGWLALF